ncbi:N-acetylhexosaminidase [Gloeophyllum trabeum ATCC 11539]|uniref:Beta-hexosaminidase n=1 Tax=Gloeophyllum trabeum (strain ATCC 11539 / FP-39264 / Madison 617) TaxID=670483 RepID=S7Q478_GLOTA|nr:N-acetylhexosaminidase [Gloeophyllum trabeum ATCC 11539]EPQ54821.1 N-acetylhexosaminidase [Gloeophyllum trabeum ATCC 11539]
MVPKFAFAAATAVLLAFTPVNAVWPLPTSFTTGSTALRLAPWFDIHIDVHGAPGDLVNAVKRTKQQLWNDKLERLVVGRGGVDADAVFKAGQLNGLTISLENGAKVRSISEEAVAPLESRDESYTLTIPGSGSGALLKANSTLGLFRGLTTFSQLFYYYKNNVYTIEAPIEITDKPAYPYRGLMLDTARNYFPVKDLERTLDAMSWVKINNFHWHVVDSQSFPLEIPGFEDLAEKGAYSADSVYTTDDVSHIVSYAAARGIDVIVEIDTPGHTAIISNAHPEYVACAQSTPWASFANEPPAGQLRFTEPAVTNFTSDLFTAVSKLFPSKFVSTGGDELNVNCYDQDPVTQATLNATGQTLEQALDTFTQATHGALKEAGKTPIVWEEMVLDHNVTLSNDTIVLVWISSQNVVDVAKKGYKVVHAASDYFYLDCGGGGWVGSNPAGNSWCDPFKTWQRSYTFDPTANLTAEESKLILGGQHLLWTEQSGPENLDPIVWPRAASSAELFWTGPALTNVTTALPRLHDVAFRFRQRGVQAISLQPLWCALRPGACDLTA